MQFHRNDTATPPPQRNSSDAPSPQRTATGWSAHVLVVTNANRRTNPLSYTTFPVGLVLAACNPYIKLCLFEYPP